MRKLVRPRTRWRRSKGFTLVELLVVIGVIALLAALLLGVLGRAQVSARVASCGSNLSQIFKAARMYANVWRDLLPDLYAGLPEAQHATRYRTSHYTRNTDTEGHDVPCGLWLIATGDYAPSNELYYCPNTPGPYRYNATGNQAVEGVPQMCYYAYNYFPDTVPESQPGRLEPPLGLTLDDVSNCLSVPRKPRFYALLADVFINSLEMTHRARNGLNVCYCDGSVQWVSLGTEKIPWNDTTTIEGSEADAFSDDLPGYRAVRDAWEFLSRRRR